LFEHADLTGNICLLVFHGFDQGMRNKKVKMRNSLGIGKMSMDNAIKESSRK